MGAVIKKDIIKQPPREDFYIPEEIKAESEIAEKVVTGVENAEGVGNLFCNIPLNYVFFFLPSFLFTNVYFAGR
jgi:hypothetical protein